jgi:long-chain acyl-CoA synthetase
MYPGSVALRTPDKPALIAAASGRAVTYRELDERSNRLAQLLYAAGLRRGDRIAIFMENNLRYMEVAWAALRSGLYITPVNRFLTAEEVAYIVDDCDAQALVSSAALAGVAAALPELIPRCRIRLMVDGTLPGWQAYELATAAHPATPLAQEPAGTMMFYSSGTTGRPKGIVTALRDAHASVPSAYTLAHIELNRFTEETVYLSPAPMYHAAPFAYSISVQAAGGTVVMMEKFDPLDALHAIERYRVTHGQWVPTMFVRLLRLPDEERRRFDPSSMQLALHAAAPCPVEIKRRMIEWWGPIIEEYYAASEGMGATRINTPEWLAHPGSVGRATRGITRICGEDGEELPVGETGVVYFEETPGMIPFEYHKDREKSAAARNPRHPSWSTVGDIGHVDAEGYLYLTDRKSFMIISGGVNIYPQQIEDALILHPKVRDVAVIGVPNEEMGEEVKAVVELMDGVAPGEAIAAELRAYLETRIGRHMLPRSYDFVDQLPRLPTGKLYKKVLRDKYWPPRA